MLSFSGQSFSCCVFCNSTAPLGGVCLSCLSSLLLNARCSLFVALGLVCLTPWLVERLARPRSGVKSASEGSSASPLEGPRPFAPAAPMASAGLREELTELERVRREKEALEVELDALRVRLARSELETTAAREDLAELRRPLNLDVMSSTLSAELSSGEVVVTGGFRLPDGTRMFAFVQPTLEKVEGADVVRIRSAWRGVTDGISGAVGLDSLATNADNTLQHGEVWLADEKREVFRALDTDPEAVAVVNPDVTVLPGVGSVIAVGDLRLKVTPTLGDASGRLSFEVRVELARPADAAATPAPSAPDQRP